MPGKLLCKVAYIFFFALLPFTVQWGAFPPVVSTAQAQSDDAAKSLMDTINRAVACGRFGNVGLNRCKEEPPDIGVGSDTRGANPDRDDACEECHFRANELRDQWKANKKKWADRKAELEAQGIKEGTREYNEGFQDLRKEKDRLRRAWEAHSHTCFQLDCKIGKISDKKTSAPPKGSRSAPSTMPSSEPSATPEPSGKPPPDKYESCIQMTDPKYRNDDDYIEWYNAYCKV